MRRLGHFNKMAEPTVRRDAGSEKLAGIIKQVALEKGYAVYGDRLKPLSNEA